MCRIESVYYLCNMWLDVILAKNHPKETHPQGISMRGEGKCQWFHCINCDRNKSIVYRVGFLNFTHNEYTYNIYLEAFTLLESINTLLLIMSSHLNKLSALAILLKGPRRLWPPPLAFKNLHIHLNCFKGMKNKEKVQ